MKKLQIAAMTLPALPWPVPVALLMRTPFRTVVNQFHPRRRVRAAARTSLQPRVIHAAESAPQRGRAHKHASSTPPSPRRSADEPTTTTPRSAASSAAPRNRCAP
jgi:hypothetical protein